MAGGAGRRALQHRAAVSGAPAAWRNHMARRRRRCSCTPKMNCVFLCHQFFMGAAAAPL